MHMIPMDYESIFRDRVLIISGVGRSGTTILGNVIGSMTHTYYLFEPACMKYLVHPTRPCNPIAFLGTLFEDYFMPLIQGRGYNHNPADWTYYCNYITEEELKSRWKLNRRADALKKAQEERPLFVIKTNEAQLCFGEMKKIFPGAQFIHLIRNGNDVVASSLFRGWYTPDYYDTVIDWAQDETIDSGLPELQFNRRIKQFASMPATAAARAWRTLVKAGMEFSEEHPVSVMSPRYESLKDDIEDSCQWMESMWNVKRTGITSQHIKSIKQFKAKKYPDITDQIVKPELGNFTNLMRTLGYE